MNFQKIKEIFFQIFIFLFCAILTAGFLVLSYPKFDLGFLAWIAFAPFALGIALLKKRSWQILFGFFTGFLFYVGVLYWIYFTCRAGEVSPAFSYLAWLSLSLVLCGEWVLFSLFASLAPRNNLYPLFISLCWVIVEWLKVFAAEKFIWFPWFMAGYTQWDYTALIQIASVTGVYGISFAIVFAGASLGYGLLQKNTAGFFKLLIAPVAVILIIFIFGLNRIYNKQTDTGNTIKVSVLQPNIDQYKKWTLQYESEIEKNLENLLTEAAPKSPDLVVYPEAALPGYREEPKWLEFIDRSGKIVKAHQLIGAVSSRNNKKYISAFLFDKEGKFIGVYDKEHLVPFGEYMPFGFLSKYVPVLGKLGGFDAGSNRQDNISFNDINLAVGICYETIFGKMWRKKVRNSANILVNITNDGWYLNTAGPYQHFVPAVFRAVENDRPVIRAANTGISAYIDGTGKIIKKTELGERTVLTVDAKFKKRPLTTFYTRFGDVFASLCMVLFLFLLLKRH